METKPLIKEKLKLLTGQSGVYLMHDANNEIIYIGKAKNLKRRVSSYFNRNHDTPKLRVMVPQIERFEFIITDTEVEALLLESHLIKKHKPKYNVLLKDDKKYPWFLITDEEYPRILIVRKNNKINPKGKYFGPYTNGRAMYSTLELIKKLFPLKQCKTPKFKTRPCLYYQISKCMAPCQRLVSPEEYRKVVNQVELFLSGKQHELVEELKKQMERYAQSQEYEKAAKYRDSYFDVQKAIENQKVVSDNTSINQDIIGFVNDENCLSISLLEVRGGRFTNKKDFDVQLNEIDSYQEGLLAFLKDYYQMLDKNEIPKEILLSDEIEKDEKELITEWLTIKKGQKVTISTPKLQKKHEFVQLAVKNSFANLENINLKKAQQMQNDWNEVGSYIMDKLELPQFPHRIECFDISHIQGTNTVASMVVFINGKPAKSEYRKFKIKNIQGKPDDFESMREVVFRRYSGVLKNDLQLTNLVIIDGGKGQLSSAKEILDSIGLINLSVVSLAKRLEEVFIPEKPEPVIFPTTSSALFLFQQIRDEAHRFAISYHRKLRDNQALKSIFDEIPGFSASKKKLLFEHFKDIKTISNASQEELEIILGKKLSSKVYKQLHTDN